MIAAAVEAIDRAIRDGLEGVAGFRATVVSTSGAMVQIQRIGEATPGTEKYPSLARSPIHVSDVVLCLPLGAGGKPVIVDVIRSALTTTPTYTLLANAGNTATASITGDDNSGTITVTPNGTGIALGTFVEIDFPAGLPKPNTSYAVNVNRTDLGAGTLDIRPTGKTTARFRLWSAAALTAGTVYSFDWSVRQNG